MTNENVSFEVFRPDVFPGQLAEADLSSGSQQFGAVDSDEEEKQLECRTIEEEKAIEDVNEMGWRLAELLDSPRRLPRFEDYNLRSQENILDKNVS